MSFSKYVFVAALTALAIVGGSSQAIAQDEKPPIVSLESRIETILENDAALAGHYIDADVSRTVVTLKGTVRTQAEKARAERLAKIEGVTRVQNDIVVDANAPLLSKADRAAAKVKAGAGKAIDATKTATEKTVDKTKEVAAKTAEKTKEIAGETKDKTKEVAGKTADKTKEVAGKTAEKTKEAASTTGEVITDAWITTKLKAKFIDEDALKGSDIDVDTNDHVVTLKGTVKSAAGRARAEEVAKKTDGVKRVVNRLVIKP